MEGSACIIYLNDKRWAWARSKLHELLASARLEMVIRPNNCLKFEWFGCLLAQQQEIVTVQASRGELPSRTSTFLWYWWEGKHTIDVMIPLLYYAFI